MRKEAGIVTCYMRHMAWLFETFGVEDDKPGRRRLDTALRSVLATDEDAHCPEIWTAYKALPDTERDALVPELREALGL